MDIPSKSESAFESMFPLLLPGDDQRLCTHAGKRVGDRIVSTGQAGYLVYGPFIKLPAGRYRVVINGLLDDYGHEGAYADVAIDGGSKILGKHQIGHADDYDCLGSIIISHQDPDALMEIRVWVSEQCLLNISSICILPDFAPELQQHSQPEDKRPLPVWVLITGIVRDEEFLLSRFQFFSNLKKAGKIQQVVFSTWKGEIDKFPRVSECLQKFDFVLVESDAPEIICHGHYLHQIVSIENGLSVCPDNSFIFKTRTDKSGPESHFFEDKIVTFFEKENCQRKCDAKSPLLTYKIGLSGLYFTEKSLHLPVLFFWNDINYFGLKQDLQKLLNYDVLSFGYRNLIPEQALFASHFIHFWPCLSAFFKGMNQWETIVTFIFHGNEISAESRNAVTNFLASNRLFKHAFIAERYILHKYFFDIPSGENIEFNTRHRGIELRNDEESNRLLDPLSARNLISADYSADAESLMTYLNEQFGISRVHKKTEKVTGKHFIFDTRNSGITIKNPV